MRDSRQGVYLPAYRILRSYSDRIVAYHPLSCIVYAYLRIVPRPYATSQQPGAAASIRHRWQIRSKRHWWRGDLVDAPVEMARLNLCEATLLGRAQPAPLGLAQVVVTAQQRVPVADDRLYPRSIAADAWMQSLWDTHILALTWRCLCDMQQGQPIEMSGDPPYEPREHGLRRHHLGNDRG